MKITSILLVSSFSEDNSVISKAFELEGYEIVLVGTMNALTEMTLQQPYDLVIVNEESWEKIQNYRRKSTAFQRLPTLMTNVSPTEKIELDEIRKDTPEVLKNTWYLPRPFSLRDCFQTFDDIEAGIATKPSESKAMRKEAMLDTDNETPTGTLSEMPLPKLLTLLWKDQATGFLRLENSKLKKIIGIRNGYPIFTRSNTLNETLGQRLVSNGLISEVDRVKSIRLSKDAGTFQGAELVKMGALNDAQLQTELEKQSTSTILEIFSWKYGTYRFQPKQTLAKELEVEISSSPIMLIIDGVRHEYDNSKISKILSMNAHLYLHNLRDINFHQYALFCSQEDQKLLDMLHSSETVANLLKSAGDAKNKLGRLVVAVLEAGVMTGKSTPQETATAPSIEAQTPEIQEAAQIVKKDTKTQQQKFLAYYNTAIQKDHFELLGLKRTCTDDEVKTRYEILSEKFKPKVILKKHSGLQELQNEVNCLAEQIDLAYKTLKTAESRKQYSDPEPEVSDPDSCTSAISNILDAETEFLSGVSSIRDNNFSKALNHLEAARKIYIEDTDCTVLYAWALFMNNPDNIESRKNAKKLLKTASKTVPGDADLYYYLGKIHSTENDFVPARKFLKLALKYNNHHAGALKELRNMPEEAPTFLRKIFSRKAKKVSEETEDKISATLPTPKNKP